MDAEHVGNVLALRAEVERLRLDGWESVAILPIDALAASYNGTGADWMPPSMRRALDGICAPFAPAVMVHDVETDASDGTMTTFNEVNRRFLKNCQTCAKDAHPWYSWKRYALLLQARAMYDAVDEFGWKAWTDAYIDAKINYRSTTNQLKEKNK